MQVIIGRLKTASWLQDDCAVIELFDHDQDFFISAINKFIVEGKSATYEAIKPWIDAQSAVHVILRVVPGAVISAEFAKMPAPI